MKKILVFGLVALSFSSSAFAGALATNSVTPLPGLAVYGGTTPDEAAAATNPLVRMSTGVSGLVNFGGNNNTSPSYVIATKHFKGSKVFATANDSTNIYWKASPANLLTAGEVGTGTDNGNFGTGWTAY